MEQPSLRTFQMGTHFFRIYCYLSWIWHLHLYTSWRCWLYRKFCPTKHVFFVAGLLLFIFFKNKTRGWV